VGRSTELNPFSPAFVFRHSKYPNAAKEYLRFMLEKEQFEPWQHACIGYVAQPLKAYRSNPVWTEDPKHTPYRDTPERTLDSGYAGKLGPASAGVMADYVVVNMVAEAASGASTPQAAAAKAEKRAARYYR
jgi:multiple sugar transport system substrate-binding protein